jgi:shikimate dehydrogenase
MIRAAVIGHPIAHSKSPLIHGYWLNQLGIKGQYDRIDVPPESLGDFVRSVANAGLLGVNVTLPHKINAAQHVQSLTPLAAQVGAVNTIVVQADGNLLGHNTDVGGFALPLSKIRDFKGQKAVVLGAGGAARAIVAGLVGLGVSDIHVVNRSMDKIAGLADIVQVEPHDWTGIHAALEGAAILVNTTSLGMAGQPPLEIDIAPLAKDAVVNDIVYAPLETPLLAQARARGYATVDGLEMLIGQAAEAFALFYGQAPDRSEDAKLRAILLQA